MDAVRRTGLAFVADSLTALRFLIALTVIATSWFGLWEVTAVMVSVAWLSDLLDGRVAQIASRPTRLGRWDMTADTAVGAGLAIGLGGNGSMPAWVAASAVVVFGGLFLVGNLAASMLLQLVGYVPFLLLLWDQRPALWWFPFATVALIAVADWRRLVFFNIPSFLRGMAGKFEHGHSS